MALVAGPRLNLELTVDVREVRLDGLRGDEERLRDLAVRLPVGRHLGDPPLARGERVDSAANEATGPRPRREGSACVRSARTIAPQRRASSSPSWRWERASARWLARRRAAPNSVERLRPLELRLRRWRARPPTRGGARDPRRRLRRARRPAVRRRAGAGSPAASKLDLLPDEPAGLLPIAQAECRERCLGSATPNSSDCGSRRIGCFRLPREDRQVLALRPR